MSLRDCIAGYENALQTGAHPRMHDASREEKRQWLEACLRECGYEHLTREERGVVRRYVQTVTGYSRAQMARYVSHFVPDIAKVVKQHAPAVGRFYGVVGLTSLMLLSIVVSIPRMLPARDSLAFLNAERTVNADEPRAVPRALTVRTHDGVLFALGEVAAPSANGSVREVLAASNEQTLRSRVEARRVARLAQILSPIGGRGEQIPEVLHGAGDLSLIDMLGGGSEGQVLTVKNGRVVWANPNFSGTGRLPSQVRKGSGAEGDAPSRSGGGGGGGGSAAASTTTTTTIVQTIDSAEWTEVSGITYLTDLTQSVGIGTSAPKAKLDVVGSISGTTLTLAGLANCDTIDTDDDGNLICGTDSTLGSGLSQSAGDERYVNVSGDTMTGALTVRDTISGASLYVGTSIQGAGLTDCDADGQTLAWDATTGRFSCGDDDSGGSSVTAGQGLGLNGSVLTLNSAISGALLEFQTVSGATVFANTALRSSGSLVFEGAASGASLYVATSLQGAGLADCDLANQTLNWDATTGRFSCGTDSDSDTTYTPGEGLTLTATSFSLSDTISGALIDFTTVSGSLVRAADTLASSGSLVFEGAASGASLYVATSLQGAGLADCDLANQTLNWDASTGRFSCGTDADTDTDTTYTAGQGLALTATSFSLNSAISGALLEFTTVSGSLVTANTLASSGSLVWEGAASGSSLYIASSLQGVGLTDCDASSQNLLWDATTGRFSCGTDESAGSGLGQNEADLRYVNQSGDTMTGALVIDLKDVTSGVGLEVLETISGSTIFANNGLSTSGSLVWEGAASGSSLYLGTSLQGVGLTDCDADGQTLAWDASTGRFSCGDDDSGGSSSTAGQGLTLTATALSLSSTISGSLVDFTTVSGSLVRAADTLASSGSLVFEGAASGASLYVATSIQGAGLADCDLATQTLAWDATTGRFSCGTDSDTTYTAGQGIGLAGSVLSLNSAISGALLEFTTVSGSLVRANTLASSGSLVFEGAASGASLYIASSLQGVGLTDCDVAGTSKLLWDSTTGRFSCGTDADTDTDTTYTAGEGLSLTATALSLSDTISGALLEFTTVSGSLVRANTLASSGSLVFEGAGSGNSLYIAQSIQGAGLADCDLATQTLAWDATTGRFSCGTDSDTTYTAGQGIGLAGSVLSLNSAISGALLEFTTVSGSLVRANTLASSGSLVFEGAASGASLYIASSLQGVGLTDCDVAGTSKLLWDSTTGRFSCGTDADTDTDTTYTAGEGLSLTATALSLSDTISGALLEFQTVSGSVVTTNTLRSSGSLVFEGAASGASLYIASSIQGVGLTDCDVAGTSKLLWDASTGRFSCGTDANTGTSYTAGEGLTLDGTAFSLSDSISGTLLEFQTISGSLVYGSKTVASSGSLIFEGAASGSSLYVATSFQGAGLTDCDLSTQTLAWDESTGRFSCGTDSDTTYTAGQGIGLAGSVLSLNSAISGALLEFTTVSGSLVRANTLASSGSLVFEGAASGASLYIASSLQGVGLTDCDIAGTSKLLWDADTGRFSCGSDANTGTSYTAGEGLTLDGTAFSLSDTISGALLEFQTVSGSIVYASQSLRSSGSLVWEGAASGSTLHVGLAYFDIINVQNGATIVGPTVNLEATGGINLDSNASFTQIGDINNDFNSTTLLIEDSLQRITLNAAITSLSGNLGVGTTDPDTALEIIGVASGTTVYANSSLRSSGSLVWEGAGSGNSLYLGGSLQGVGLSDCDTGATSKLLWDASTGRFSCGTDQTGGSSLTAGQGLTLTSTALSVSSSISGALLEFQTVSGSLVYGSKTVASSGSLVWEGTASGNTLVVSRIASHLIPSADDTWDIGTSALRWKDLYLSGSTIYMGAAGDEGTIKYNTVGNNFAFDTSNDGVAELTFSTAGLEYTGGGTLSGSTLYATKSLRSSGSLVWEGAASGASLFVGTSIKGAGLSDCDTAGTSKLLWDATTGRFSCGTDQGGSSGLSVEDGDARYVNTSGDTMTGSLNIGNGGVLNVNGVTGVAYNTFSNIGSASHNASGEIEDGNDVFISEDLEVDGTVWLDGDLTVAGTVTLAGLSIASLTVTDTALEIDKPLNVNGVTGTAYNTFSNIGSASHTASGEIEDGNDVFISEDLEVDGDVWFDGGLTVAGSLHGAGLDDCDDASASKLLWDTTTGEFSCGSDQGGGITVKVKTANETVNNSSTLQDDDELNFAIGASEHWAYVMHLELYQASGTPGFKAAVTAPSAATCILTAFPEGSSAAAVSPTCGGTVAPSGSLMSGYQGMVLYGSVRNDSNAGTVQLQWAQNSASMNDTKVVSGSHLLAFKTVGADLAEIYAAHEPLIPGTVVTLDPSLPYGVKASATPYDSRVMGVVSTQPGLLIGEPLPQGAPVFLALAGRVPTLVSAENGPIEAGDYLTSSSQPGVAMRATEGGMVVGQAMEGFDGEGIGAVMTFIKNTYLPGDEGAGAALVLSGSTLQDRPAADSGALIDIAGEIARQIEPLRTELFAVLSAGSGSAFTSDLTLSTLQLASTLSVGGDARIAGDLHLDGSLLTNDLFVPGILAVDGSLTSNSLTVTGDTDIHGTLTLHGPLALGSGASLLFGSGLTLDSLVVERSLAVLGDITIDGFARFLGSVAIEGELTVTRQAGHLTIPFGGTGVTMHFDPAFTGLPVVTASPNVPVLYAVSVATQTGFTISLAAPAPAPVTFSWTALVIPMPAAGVLAAEIVPSGLVFPVDSLGIPVSSSLQWNACIRSVPLFDASGVPFSCSRYHDANTWEHPDLGFSFVWNDALTPPYMQLPDGYVATVTEDAATVRDAIGFVNEVQDPTIEAEAESGEQIEEETEAEAEAGTGTSLDLQPQPGVNPEPAEWVAADNEEHAEPEPVPEEVIVPEPIIEEPIIEEPAPVLEEPIVEEPVTPVASEEVSS